MVSASVLFGAELLETNNKRVALESAASLLNIASDYQDAELNQVEKLYLLFAANANFFKSATSVFDMQLPRGALVAYPQGRYREELLRLIRARDFDSLKKFGIDLSAVGDVENDNLLQIANVLGKCWPELLPLASNAASLSGETLPDVIHYSVELNFGDEDLAALSRSIEFREAAEICPRAIIDQSVIDYAADSGFPFAEVTDLDATYDAATSQMQLRYTIDPGEVVFISRLRFASDPVFREEHLQKFSTFPRDGRFSQTGLNKLYERLDGSGSLDSTTIDLVANDDGHELVISASRTDRRSLQLGIGYSSLLNFSATAGLHLGNLSGVEDSLDFALAHNSVESVFNSSYRLDNLFRYGTALDLTAALGDVSLPAYEQEFSRAAVSVEQMLPSFRGALLNLSAGAERGKQVSLLSGREFEPSYVFFGSGFQRDGAVFDLELHATRFTPTSSSDGADFVRVEGGVNFQTLQVGGWSLGHELRFTSIKSDAIGQLPPAYRIYLGGTGSNRGYEYNEVHGAESDDATQESGISMLNELSVGLAPMLQGVDALFFVDASRVSAGGESFDLLGIGAGLGYDLGSGRSLVARVGKPLKVFNGRDSLVVSIAVEGGF